MIACHRRVPLASTAVLTPITQALEHGALTRRELKALMRRWIRRPVDGTAKPWVLWGRSGKGHICGITLRRLVASPKRQFRWRNPTVNPYLLRDEEHSTVTSRYHDVAMAMGRS